MISSTIYITNLANRRFMFLYALPGRLSHIEVTFLGGETKTIESPDEETTSAIIAQIYRIGGVEEGQSIKDAPIAYALGHAPSAKWIEKARGDLIDNSKKRLKKYYTKTEEERLEEEERIRQQDIEAANSAKRLGVPLLKPIVPVLEVTKL